MKKNTKILKKIAMLIVSFVMICQSVFAAELSNIYDIRIEDSTYVASQASDIIFPYVRAMTGKLVLDKNVGKSGLNITKDKIEVTGTYTGMQVFISGTEVIFKGKVDQAIIVAPKIVIDGESTNTLVAIATNIDVSEKAKLNDLVINSINSNINGTISGNLLGKSAKIDLKGTITKDLRIETQRIDVLAKKIQGNVIIDTFNPTLTVKYAYPKAKINVLEKSIKLTNDELKVILIKEVKLAIIAMISFALIFLIIRTLAKREKIITTVKTIKGNTLFTAFMGVLGALMIPIDIFVLGFLISVGIKEVAVALLLVYLAFISATFLLAPYIVSMLLFFSIKKYIIQDRTELVKDTLFSVLVFTVLYTLTRIPVLGPVMSVVYFIIVIGSIITLVAKKIDKNI